MNQIIQGLWIGGELSTMEQLSIKSFLANGHDYHLYVYDKVENIPEGTVVKDGNEILPKDKIFTYQVGWGKGSYAGFSDFFRYHLLKNKGGWWVDTDVICLKYFDFAQDYVICSSYEGKWGEIANSCVLKFPKGSDLSFYLTEVCDRTNTATVKFGETGPNLVQKAVAELKYQNSIVSYQAFCPISWRTVDKIVYRNKSITFQETVNSVKDFLRPIIRPQTKPSKITNNSYAVHLWNEIWRQNKLNKNGLYAKNCLYERLKAKYL